MSLEYRSSKPVYYRNVRRGGKPRKEYVASGVAAELVADVNEAAKEKKQRHKEAEEQFREQLKRADESILELEVESNMIVHAALHVAGYHQHKREWRRKREPTTAS